ncbi:MAG TPA: NfeD family protein [Solirubrobacteraceae bacterium]|jgi:membrane-bound ClpP family serine protease|nr:NfeD family protein [Solirubrobacteraceae bacterium]
MNALIVALVVIGASLLIVEAHVASYGVLGVLGVAALSGAAVLAAEAAGGSALLALALVLPAAILMSVFSLVAARKALALRRRRPHAGPEALIGRIGVMRHGDVVVSGERWRARRSWDEDGSALEEGDQVVVEQVQGLTLAVRRAEEWEVL